MRVKILPYIAMIVSILIIGIFLLSYTYSEPQPTVQGKPAIYIVEDPKLKVYIAGDGENTVSWLEESKTKRYELNKIRALREFEEDQKEFELKSKLSNVRRIVDSKLVIGYDKYLDDPRWIEVDS